MRWQRGERVRGVITIKGPLTRRRDKLVHVVGAKPIKHPNPSEIDDGNSGNYTQNGNHSCLRVRHVKEQMLKFSQHKS